MNPSPAKRRRAASRICWRLLRSAGFFDWAGAGQSLLVLSSYALAGLILVTAGALRRRRDPTPGPATPASEVAVAA